MRNFFFFFLLGFQLSFAQTPERYISHRVKKGETLIQITERYNVSQDQILEFNPSVEKTGIKRRMTLRVPIYSKSNNSKNLPRIKGIDINIIENKAHVFHSSDMNSITYIGIGLSFINGGFL